MPHPVPAGSVRLRLREVMLARGYAHPSTGSYAGRPNIHRLAREVGMAYDALHYLVVRPDEAVMIRFDTLAKLCYALGCEPGDLLEHRRVPTLEFGGGARVGEEEALTW